MALTEHIKHLPAELVWWVAEPGGKDGKGEKFSKGYKGEETVERHDFTCLEETRHIKEVVPPYTWFGKNEQLTIIFISILIAKIINAITHNH